MRQTIRRAIATTLSLAVFPVHGEPFTASPGGEDRDRRRDRRSRGRRDRRDRDKRTAGRAAMARASACSRAAGRRYMTTGGEAARAPPAPASR